MSSQQSRPPRAPAPAPGLRERKKQQTRLAISQVATRMFIERGFDQVTLAEVAEAANVSVNTVFNYFETKEELFFDRADEVAAAPSLAVRDRPVGESAIGAVHRHFVTSVTGAGASLFSPHVKPFFAAVEASPALKARERLIFDDLEHRLVQALTEQTGAAAGDPTARSVAAMTTALLWMLQQELRARMMRDEPMARIRAAVLELAERGFALLERGAGRYATRKKGGGPATSREP
jgi:AcrR family transcriptional regulator